MRDLVSAPAMWGKAAMFLVAGGMAGGLVLVEAPSWKVAALLEVTVWSFCRVYYFVFYGVERYADAGYRFSGLMSVARYVWRKRRGVS